MTITETDGIYTQVFPGGYPFADMLDDERIPPAGGNPGKPGLMGLTSEVAPSWLAPYPVGNWIAANNETVPVTMFSVPENRTTLQTLVAGTYADDNLSVYWSADSGATWQSYAAPFGRRINSELVAHNNALYVISGDDPPNDDTQDIWRMALAGDSAAHWTNLGQYHAKHIRSDHQAVSWNGDLLIPAGRAFVPFRAEDRAAHFTNQGANSDRFHSANGRFLYGNTFLRLRAGANAANAASWQIGKQAGLNNVATKSTGDPLGYTGVRQYALILHQNRLHIFGNYGDNTPGQRRRVSYTDGITGALGENADWVACGDGNILTSARSYMSAVSWNRYYYVFGTGGTGIERRESGCVPSTILGAQPPTQKHDTQALLLPLGTHPFD